jgi:Rieske Fe-S protein
MQRRIGQVPAVIGRRRLFLVTAGAAVACTSSTADPLAGSGGTAAGSCGHAAKGPGLGYCVVAQEELVFPGAASLAVGEAMLRSFDDKTAAIVVRDAKGLYALSAICTHACCTVSLCGSGDTCASPLLSPRDCADASRGPISPTGPAFLCPCHGSLFSADGKVTQGPAQIALPSVAMRVSGKDVLVDLSVAAPLDARG